MYCASPIPGPVLLPLPHSPRLTARPLDSFPLPLVHHPRAAHHVMPQGDPASTPSAPRLRLLGLLQPRHYHRPAARGGRVDDLVHQLPAWDIRRFGLEDRGERPSGCRPVRQLAPISEVLRQPPVTVSAASRASACRARALPGRAGSRAPRNRSLDNHCRPGKGTPRTSLGPSSWSAGPVSSPPRKACSASRTPH